MVGVVIQELGAQRGRLDPFDRAEAGLEQAQRTARGMGPVCGLGHLGEAAPTAQFEQRPDEVGCGIGQRAIEIEQHGATVKKMHHCGRVACKI